MHGMLDHKGNEYKSIQDMCKYYGVVTNTFYKRRKRGWSLKDCLEGRPVYDSDNNKYPSIRKMCIAHNVNSESVSYLISTKGYSPAKAVDQLKFKAISPDGNTYRTIQEMCRDHDVSYNTYIQRKKSGRSQEECLSPIRLKKRCKT